MRTQNIFELKKKKTSDDFSQGLVVAHHCHVCKHIFNHVLMCFEFDYSLNNTFHRFFFGGDIKIFKLSSLTVEIMCIHLCAYGN